MPAGFRVHRLTAQDVPMMPRLNEMFGEVFGMPEEYTGRPASHGYLQRLLGNPGFIALAALEADAVIGGLVAYEFIKFEQERNEVYIYDLAVRAAHRRRGVATALIERACAIAAEQGAWAVYVQADTGEEDAPAIALYSKLGTREEVLHFNLPVPRRGGE